MITIFYSDASHPTGCRILPNASILNLMEFAIMDTMLNRTLYRRNGTGKRFEPLLYSAGTASHSSASKRIDLMPLTADRRISQTHSVYEHRLTGVPPCLTVT
jgi:hypothetical protein